MKEYVFAIAGGLLASMSHYILVMRPALLKQQAEAKKQQEEFRKLYERIRKP